MNNFINIKEFNNLIIDIINKIQLKENENKKYLVYQSKLFKNKLILNETLNFINSDKIKDNFKVNKIDNDKLFISWQSNFFKVKKMDFNLKDNTFKILTIYYSFPLITNNYLIKLHFKLVLEEYYKEEKMLTPISINNYLQQTGTSISEFSKRINIKPKRIEEILNYSLMNKFENNKIKKGII